MNPKISRLIKITIFIFTVVLADRGIGFVLRKLYFNQKAGQNSTLNYIFSKCKSDVLILGNSRAQHHYDCRILSSDLNMSCYNAGQDGGHSILLPYAQMKVITERYSPKIVILEFFTEGIVHYPGDYDRLSILLPYYKEFPEIRPLILRRSPYETIKLMSSIYPFNSNAVDIIGFNTKIGAGSKQDIKGFVPLNRVMNAGMLDQTDLSGKSEKTRQLIVDPNMVSALEDIIRLCKEKNITLFIITSPLFGTLDTKKDLCLQSQSFLGIIRKNQIKYWDFSFDTTFAGHMELFADVDHLNERGAAIFSKMLTDSIKKTAGGYARNEPGLHIPDELNFQ